MSFRSYLWVIPALFVSYIFIATGLEGVQGSDEFREIISVVPVLIPFAVPLGYVVGFFDMLVGVSLVFIPRLKPYIFFWVALWPLIPAVLRVMGGVGEFEVTQVVAVLGASVLSFVLWRRGSK